MSAEKIKEKTEKVLEIIGVKVLDCQDVVVKLIDRLVFLSKTNRYNKLLKLIFASNTIENFNAYIFEAFFACDFEFRKCQLFYEESKLSESNTTVDFSYKRSNRKEICFDLRLIGQRKGITDSIREQFKDSIFAECQLNGEGEKDEILRLQNIILSKCQDKKGNQIKFRKQAHNFIVVFISDLILHAFDKDDCMETMYGSGNIPEHFRHGIFGLCQQLPNNASEKVKRYYSGFKNFREVMDGVLFVKKADRSNFLVKDVPVYLDMNLEYFLVGNNNIIKKEEFDRITKELSSFLPQWSKREK